MNIIQKKREIWENLYDSIIDFRLLGLEPIRKIMNYLDSPGPCKFLVERYVKFHELGCYNFDEAEWYNDKTQMKFIKWLHINLIDFLKLIDEYRATEKRIYDFVANCFEDDVLYDAISRLTYEMQLMLTRIKEHSLQVVDDKLQEINEKFYNMNLGNTDFSSLYSKYLEINQVFISSIIQLHPEILNTNIEDITQYLSQDFYLKDENLLLDVLEKKIDELKY